MMFLHQLTLSQPKIMENTVIPFHLLLFTLFTFIATTSCTESTSNPVENDIIQEAVCALVNCGEGTCRFSNDPGHSIIVVPQYGPVGFDCDCYSGYKKIEIPIGSFKYPTCLLPDCSMDLSCNSFTSLPPLSTPAQLPASCALVWCNEGTCVANGTSSYTCNCNQGSLNLFDNPQLACFKKCSFGGDCKKLGLPGGSPNVPPSTKQYVTMILLTSIFLTWI